MVLSLAFPYHQDIPTLLTQCRASFLVSVKSSLKLLHPVVSVGSRNRGVLTALVLVPKASIDEYSRPIARHHNVGLPGHSGYMEPIAIPKPVHQGPDPQFW